jgi:hypothetical protein
MTSSTQKRLALAGVAVALGVFGAGTAQLFVVAFQSQPDCVVVENGAMPSKHSC